MNYEQGVLIPLIDTDQVTRNEKSELINFYGGNPQLLSLATTLLLTRGHFNFLGMKDMIRRVETSVLVGINRKVDLLRRDTIDRCKRYAISPLEFLSQSWQSTSLYQKTELFGLAAVEGNNREMLALAKRLNLTKRFSFDAFARSLNWEEQSFESSPTIYTSHPVPLSYRGFHVSFQSYTDSDIPRNEMIVLPRDVHALEEILTASRS